MNAVPGGRELTAQQYYGSTYYFGAVPHPPVRAGPIPVHTPSLPSPPASHPSEVASATGFQFGKFYNSI